MGGKFRTAENVYVAVVCLLGFGLAVILDRRGMPQKWHAAIVGTCVSFGGVSWVFHARWRRPWFWLAFVICFAAHMLMIWVVFGQILAGTKYFGILIWAPIAFAEGIVLLGFIPALERRMRDWGRAHPSR
jgi:hypothetical protein